MKYHWNIITQTPYSAQYIGADGFTYGTVIAVNPPDEFGTVNAWANSPGWPHARFANYDGPTAINSARIWVQKQFDVRTTK